MKNHHIKKDTKEFFEGWYFKHQSPEQTISFIPGIHIDKDKEIFAFIQIITNHKSYFIKYPHELFYASENLLNIEIGNNIFSKNRLFIDIDTPQLKVEARINYGPFTPLNYDIMGPFSIIPNLECNHGIISLGHSTHGYININDQHFNFDSQKGYIEKDWGSSFPLSYTWIQCNDFKDDCSIALAIADIPFCKLSFQGLIAIVYYQGKEYRFTTYNGGKVLRANERQILIKKGRYYLRITIPKGSGYPLLAPSLGDMSRVIHERPSCPAIFEFFKGKKRIFTKFSDHASFEYV